MKGVTVKITQIETFQIETPRYYGHISGHVIVKVHVDDGPVGLGEASDSTANPAGMTLGHSFGRLCFSLHRGYSSVSNRVAQLP